MNIPCDSCAKIPPSAPCTAFDLPDGRRAALCSSCRWLLRGKPQPWRFIAMARLLAGMERGAPAESLPEPMPRGAVADFLRTACRRGPRLATHPKAMWAAYVAWCAREGLLTMGRYEFIAGLRAAGLHAQIGGQMTCRGVEPIASDDPLS